ncbi:plasmid partitioning protein RepB [Rhizobium sp. TRM95111]|uniref:plasmid partitioning protein RepB n=1 Tax=Rhizobium alarense TaxID=2846851 RepID=UPI001F2444B7|nr:plasmid partitioning protein RepB [Rhizobium alarense]MCF3640566.1 plasmid partitioning protein RepB [Rhizobium alarense]
MARKNILAGLMDDTKKFTAVNPEPEETAERLSSAFKSKGALGAVTRSIDALAARADAARAMEEKLVTGQIIVDLDPDLVEDSFVSDRLQRIDDAFRDLVEAIRVHGQDSPVLVRPHPDKTGRYQIAFGHRRVRAAKELGRTVRAVVKNLDDRDHVIAQGQENSARADLSFIEKAMFAHRLEQRGFDRDTIMSAMNADKTTLSKMLSVSKRIPQDVLSSIESAREVGRDRWHDLSTRIENPESLARARLLLRRDDYLTADGERRFDMLERAVRTAGAAASGARSPKSAARTWQRQDGAVKAKITLDGKKFTLALQAPKAAAFGAYIEDNLDRLYEAFEKAHTE